MKLFRQLVLKIIWKSLVYFRNFIYKETTIQFPVPVRTENMDEVILRFPHLGVQIFQELSVGSLLNCKEVRRSWKNFIETEKPLNDKFVIMWLVYHHWKDLPTCLDWVENNFDFIMYKFKRRGIRYNISYMRIIIPRDLKNLQSETEFGGRDYQRSQTWPEHIYNTLLV